jgi:hypothetical protein
MALVKIAHLGAQPGGVISRVFALSCKGKFCKRYSERVLNKDETSHSLACDRALAHIKTWHPEVYQRIQDEIQTRAEQRLMAEIKQSASAEWQKELDREQIAAAAREAGDDDYDQD